VSWDHFLLRLTMVFIGVGGTFVLNMVGICRVVPMMSMRCACPLGPTGEVLWCMHNTRIHGSLFGVQFVVVVVLWVRRI
jgi:hypothetical protein